MEHCRKINYLLLIHTDKWSKGSKLTLKILISLEATCKENVYEIAAVTHEILNFDIWTTLQV